MGVLGLLLALGGLWASVWTVAADEVGVRQVAGQPRPSVLEPGLHLALPGYEQVHEFPRDLQRVDVQQALPAATLDATVLYRVTDPHAWLEAEGPPATLRAGVSDAAKPALRTALEALGVEELSDVDARQRASADAQRRLQGALDRRGVVVWAVLLRAHRFDPPVQEAIEARNLEARQQALVEAEAVLAALEVEHERALAEGEARVALARDAGEAAVRQVEAEGQAYAERRGAAGERLVLLAEADRTAQEAAVLALPGGDHLVALEMVEVLGRADVRFLEASALDLDRLVDGW